MIMHRDTSIRMHTLQLKVYSMLYNNYTLYDYLYLLAMFSGPKPSTIEDLWRMIWQYNISHIVMLTGIYEGGRVSL